jgi:hypothetical protein
MLPNRLLIQVTAFKVSLLLLCELFLAAGAFLYETLERHVIQPLDLKAWVIFHRFTLFYCIYVWFLFQKYQDAAA